MPAISLVIEFNHFGEIGNETLPEQGHLQIANSSLQWDYLSFWRL